MSKGKQIIKAELENVPELPGVYRMLGAERQVLYIGKAKNLKNRLASYSRDVFISNKTEAMLVLTHFLEYSVTPSESAALLLEGQLIKRFKPKFNILLKDDKSFPYLKLRSDHDYPQLLKYRGKDLKDGKFFGPFASVKDLEITLIELQKIFKLRSCSDSYFASRKRPCLQYQIKRCYAPCTGKISKPDYDELVKQVLAFLSGKNKELQAMLSEQMEKLSENLQFEVAAEVRDRIKALSYIQLKSGLSSATSIVDADIIALTEKNGEFCVQLFLYRSNSPCGNRAYFPAHAEGEGAEQVLEAFLLQHYQNTPPPAEILLSHGLENTQLIEQALKEMHSVKVKISMPQRGERVELIKNALLNAELELDKYLKISAKNSAALNEVKSLFELESLPERIEIYDNSHIQGAFAVGAMVVAGKDGFEKKEYRLFNIKHQTEQPAHGGDDYAMLKEVLTRRLTRLKQEPQRRPDLMIIDGGKGHMNVVQKVMQELEVTIPFVCMAKGVERNAGREFFHIPSKEPFTLDKNLPVMKYLQILRDEVHNFAIQSHRNKRSKAIKISSLDQIPGIGESRKKALLNYFGSFKEISGATVNELAAVPGISKEQAEIIHNSFR